MTCSLLQVSPLMSFVYAHATGYDNNGEVGTLFFDGCLGTLSYTESGFSWTCMAVWKRGLLFPSPCALTSDAEGKDTGGGGLLSILITIIAATVKSFKLDMMDVTTLEY